jgi:hypothetical protein
MRNNNISQVTTLDIHSRDAKSSRTLTNYDSKRLGGGVRSSISSFSRQSRTRLLFQARNIPDLQSILTFTVPAAEYAETATGGNYMNDGAVFKQHARRLRQWLTYRGMYGVWFLEFQERGAPHLHILVSQVLTEKQKYDLHKYWYKLIGSNCPHHRQRGVDIQELRKKEAAGGYAAKYSAKQDQKQVPDGYQNVGRFWGKFGEVPGAEERYHTSVSEIQTLCRIATRWSKAQARAKGYKVKMRGRGISGQNYFDCSTAILFYLRRFYIFPENLTRIVLLSPYSQNQTLANPSSDNIANNNALPPKLSQIRVDRYIYPDLIPCR